MKTTFTFLATAILMSAAAFAQPGQSRNDGYGNNRDVVVNNTRGGYDRGTYYFTAREKDIQISAINRDYYRKIESVRDRRFMSRTKKDHAIYSFEMQRNAEVRNVRARFNDRRNDFHQNGNRNNGRGRKGNW